MIIKYPEKLELGDVIGLTAPSQSANLEKIDKAILNLENLGFKIKETNNVRNEEKYFVSSDGKTRANEFISLWQDKEVKHIISVRGGEFLFDMIPYLHEYSDLLRTTSQVKYVQGYSDTSLLNFYLTTNYNMATMHTENLNDFWMKKLEKTQINVIDILKKNYKNNEFIQESFEKYQLNEYEEGNYEGYNLTEKVEYKLIGSKKESFNVSGRIIGGCIDVLTQLLGTKFDNTKEFCSQFKEGMIWYLDSCELSFCELYRRLYQMRLAGWFDNVNCILFGRTFVKEVVGDFTLEIALNKALGDLEIPVIYDVDIGHVPPQLVMINGTFGTFKFNNKKGKLIQKFI